MSRLLLFLTAIVLVGIAGFALIWFGAGRDLQGPSVAFLMHCQAGSFAEARAEAHPRFRAAHTTEGLAELWEHWTEAHGPFGEVVRRIGVQTAPEGAVWQERLTLDLGFKRGHVVGRFYFDHDPAADGALRLVHVALERRRAVEVPVTDRSRLEATARKLFGFLDEGRLLALYDALGPELQMRWTQTRLVEELGALRAELGALEDVVLATSREDGPRQHQLFELTFARGRAAFEVVHAHDDAEGEWTVVAFDRR